MLDSLHSRKSLSQVLGAGSPGRARDPPGKGPDCPLQLLVAPGVPGLVVMSPQLLSLWSRGLGSSLGRTPVIGLGSTHVIHDLIWRSLTEAPLWGPSPDKGTLTDLGDRDVDPSFGGLHQLTADVPWREGAFVRLELPGARQPSVHKAE